MNAVVRNFKGKSARENSKEILSTNSTNPPVLFPLGSLPVSLPQPITPNRPNARSCDFVVPAKNPQRLAFFWQHMQLLAMEELKVREWIKTLLRC